MFGDDKMKQMKDSGIEWIGQIPEEWNIWPTKRFFRHTKMLAGEQVDSYERLALTMNGVIKRSKDDLEGLQPEKFDTYQVLRENELVFKLIDLANVKTSRVGLSTYTGIVSPAYIILTFILDFVNSAEDIQKSFEPYYEETVLEEETDPNVVYDLKNTLDDFHVYQQMEIDRFSTVWYSGDTQNRGDVGKLMSHITPALQRYDALEAERQELFKSTLARFNRIYSFITQVCRLFDQDLHKFSVYAKFLYTMLPKGSSEPVDIDDKVLLEYYRLEKEFEGEITLQPTEEGFRPITGEAGRREKTKDPLTAIIEKINEMYGTDFTEMDKVLLQLENDYASEERWHSYAQNNDRKTFMLLFEKDFPEMAAQRYEQNEEFFVKMFSEPDMMKQVMGTIGGMLYERLRKRN